MTRTRVTTVLAAMLGSLYVVAGVAETIRAVTSGDGGVVFWFGSLVGGGLLVLLGTSMRRRRPGLALGLVIAGCLAGTLGTMWTVVVPVVAVAVIVLMLQDTDRVEAERLDHRRA